MHGLRKYLGEALTLLVHALLRILEGEVAPRNVVCSEAEHVLNSLCTRSTLQSFCGEHWVVFIGVALHGHEQIIEVLQVLLQ